MPFGFNPDRSKYDFVYPTPVDQGGTGATSAEVARQNLNVYGKDETFTKDEVNAKFTDSGWQTLYSGSTRNYAGTSIATYVRYRKVNGIVYVFAKGNRSELAIARTLTLPAGYRPAYDACVAAPIYDTSYSGDIMQMNRMRIKTNGQIAVEGNISSPTILECAFTYPAA